MKAYGIGVFAVGVFVSGCSSSNASTPAGDTLEIAGVWATDFGDETITSTSVSDATGVQKIVQFDNTTNVAITQYAPTDQYNPNKFARSVWTEPSGNAFYLCTVDYGLETKELALASTKTADAKDLTGKGCGGFPWTKFNEEVISL